MKFGDGAELLWFVGALVLVGSAIAARRVPIGTAIRALLGWGAIGAVAFLAVAHRHEIGAILARAGDQLGLASQQVSGGTVRIRMDTDGHFWAQVMLNGKPRRMLIDSGATLTALSPATAAAAGVASDGGFPVLIETANGTVTAQRGTVALLSVGSLETRDLRVVISPSFGDLDVLGMNFLSRLKSWRVEGNVLVLEPGGVVPADDRSPSRTNQRLLYIM